MPDLACRLNWAVAETTGPPDMTYDKDPEARPDKEMRGKPIYRNCFFIGYRQPAQSELQAARRALEYKKSRNPNVIHLKLTIIDAIRDAYRHARLVTKANATHSERIGTFVTSLRNKLCYASFSEMPVKEFNDIKHALVCTSNWEDAGKFRKHSLWSTRYSGMDLYKIARRAVNEAKEEAEIIEDGIKELQDTVAEMNLLNRRAENINKSQDAVVDGLYNIASKLD